jgi:hypothetical protein
VIRPVRSLGPNGTLFFAGNNGQRIFQQPLSWKSLGLDDRSSTLRINYRTSHQIRSHADRLLPASVTDEDGVTESRRGTVSVFDGAEPIVQTFDDMGEEQAAVGAWIAKQLAERCLPHEIGLTASLSPARTRLPSFWTILEGDRPRLLTPRPLGLFGGGLVP